MEEESAMGGGGGHSRPVVTSEDMEAGDWGTGTKEWSAYQPRAYSRKP